MTVVAASTSPSAGFISHSPKCRLGMFMSSEAFGISISSSNSNRRSTVQRRLLPHHLVLHRAQASAAGGGGGGGKDNKEEDSNQKQQPSSVSITLDDVNPVGLGRRSRQIFDEVWRKFSGLGQISRTTRADDSLDSVLIREVPMCEFTIPGAQNTTVLVVGATSRIGRIVVRKLMLRGYNVKVHSFLSVSFSLPSQSSLRESCVLDRVELLLVI